MKSVHLVIPDLFLPKDLAAEACRGLSLPALQKMLGRGHSEVPEPVPLENLLCVSFGLSCQPDAPIAPISAAFDGLDEGCWLRADPVNLDLQRDQLQLTGVRIDSGEAAVLCTSLNVHFSGLGMEFFAPHPQRWYVRLDALPRIRTTPLSQVVGGDVRGALPTGEDAARWHQLFNEIQMLLHAHPLNDAREARGEPVINSLWLWGMGGPQVTPEKSYVCAISDDVMTEMFASAAGVPFSVWPEKWRTAENNGEQLLVWTGLRSALQRGDLGAWRNSLQDFEINFARPIWQALRAGNIAKLRIDVAGVAGMRHVILTRSDTWAFWQRSRRLDGYSLV